MYRRRHFVTTTRCTDLLHAHAVAPLHLLFRAMSHDLHSTIHEALEVTVLRIQNLAQVMSPTGLSTTRSETEIEHSTEDSQIPEIEEKGKGLIYDPFPLPKKQVIVVFESRFYRKPCCASRSRLGRRTNSCSAGFITVLAGARSNCGTITNLSL